MRHRLVKKDDGTFDWVPVKELRSDGDKRSAPAAHTDDMYRGFDLGLGCYVEGRAHRKELMQRRGLTCIG